MKTKSRSKTADDLPGIAEQIAVLLRPLNRAGRQVVSTLVTGKLELAYYESRFPFRASRGSTKTK